MKQIDSPSKITGFSLTDLEIRTGGAGSLTMKSQISFQDKNGAVHGRSEYVGPWSEKTLESVFNLIKSIENDLTSIHFSVEEDDGGTTGDTRTGEGSGIPIGIIAARLGISEDKATQF